MLVLLVTAAAAALLSAVETGRLPWLLAAASLLAAAFLTKLLAALIVLPALWLTYLVFTRRPWRVRVLHLVAATGLLAVLCGGWVLAVDRTSLSSRPWIGSSTDGSAADLVLGYNGIGRITGAEQGFGGGFPGGGGGFPGGGGIDQFGGEPGIARLFNAGMGDQVMWLAPVAAATAVAGLWVAWRRRGRDPGQAAIVVLLGTWAATTFVVFSYAQGIFHNYYVSLLAPAVAGLAGIGAALVRRAGPRGRVVAAAVLVVTALVQLVLLRRVDAYHWLRPTVTILLLAVAAGLVWTAWSRTADARSPRTLAGLLATGVVALIAAPAIWSFAGDRYAANGTFPDARPVAATGFGAGGGGPGGPGGFGGGLEAMLDWLRDQRSGERWLVAVGGVQQAAAAIIDGDSIMPMGGFSGTDPAMTPARLAQLVRDGELRFVLTGGGFGGPGGFSGGGIDAVVTSACTEVPDYAGSGLYDCQNKADAIN
jgi:4-amino-4-deoxy-L-arabinose transferase-like glycosyltransferase